MSPFIANRVPEYDPHSLVFVDFESASLYETVKEVSRSCGWLGIYSINHQRYDSHETRVDNTYCSSYVSSGWPVRALRIEEQFAETICTIPAVKIENQGSQLIIEFYYSSFNSRKHIWTVDLGGIRFLGHRFTLIVRVLGRCKEITRWTHGNTIEIRRRSGDKQQLKWWAFQGMAALHAASQANINHVQLVNRETLERNIRYE